ncbi:MAG: sigma 54-interacting transcriptional regulator [Thermodesulfobacteriota bacterium]
MEKIKTLVRLNTDTILNGIADGVVVMGLDHKVLFVNRAAREILKRAGVDRISPGEKCRDVMCHSACTLDCLINTTIKTGEHIYNYDAVLENPRTGGKTEISINTALLKDETGKVIGGVEIFRDVSLIKGLKDELKDRFSFGSIIGRNHKVLEVNGLLREVAPTDATVLILGETGTGKELRAHAVHRNSPRKDGPFIRVNCAALSEGLLESEIFGHVKGAFTGAIADKPGRFELANGGTIFLDEIGDISPATQVKLLRILQEGEFERVGGTRTLKADVRIIAATNKDLKVEAANGRFREDLYYRLKVITVTLPPLRESKDDIPLLTNHFIDKFNKKMKREITHISPQALEILMEHDYPGNIRELEHIIEHAFVRCHGKTIAPEHLPPEFRDMDTVERVLASDKPLKELERETIIRALDDAGWKYQECSRKLGISRTTLWRKMRDLGIEKRKKAS